MCMHENRPNALKKLLLTCHSSLCSESFLLVMRV